MGKIKKKVKTQTAIENFKDAHYKNIMQHSLLRRVEELSLLVLKSSKLVQRLDKLGMLPTNQEIERDYAKMVAMSKSKGIKESIDNNVPILNKSSSFDDYVVRVMSALKINIQDKHSLHRLSIACSLFQIYLLYKCADIIAVLNHKEMTELESLAYRLTKHISEAIGYWTERLEGRKGSQRGGKKSTFCKPILAAVKRYLELHPHISNQSDSAITNKFVHHISNSPMIVNFNESEWDIEIKDNKLIFAIPDETSNNIEASRNIDSVRKRYVHEAKKEIIKSNRKKLATK